MATTFEDTGSDGVYTATVNWGDGTSGDADVTFADGVGTISANHTYGDNGSYLAEFTLTDPDGNSTTASTTAEISNVAPSFLALPDQTVVLGDPLILADFRVTDPGFRVVEAGTTETLDILIDWGDGTTSTPTGGDVNLIFGSEGVPTLARIDAFHIYDVPGTYTVTVTATDDDGGATTQQLLQAVVLDDVPNVATPENVAGDEGSQLTIATTFEDFVGSDGTYTATVDWGDGTSGDADVTFADGVGTISANHTYGDNGSYLAEFTLTDPDGNSTTVSTTAEISNVAPSFLALPDQTVVLGDPLILADFRVTDPGFRVVEAGTTETLDILIDWGDGTTSTPTGGDVNLIFGSEGVPTLARIDAFHIYDVPGTYTVTVTATDDDGGATTQQLLQAVVLDDVTQTGAWLPTIDFETNAIGSPLSAGDVLTDQFAEFGVHITTHDPVNNPAMIFDSANPTGNDFDLASTDQNNILIISEDADSSDPDDRAAGGTLIFTFDNPVMLDDVGLLDVDGSETATIRLYDADSNLISETLVNGAGNNQAQTAELSATLVSRMEIEFSASGAVTFVEFCRDNDHSLVSVVGNDTVNEGDTYDLTLVANNVDIEQWIVNWGDGTVDTTTDLNLTHIYTDGGNQFEIVATGFATDGSVYQSLGKTVDVLAVAPDPTDSVWLPSINFENGADGLGLESGDVITDQFAALGVHVTTNDPLNHPAMIFDSSRPTGGDTDLGTPNAAFGGPGQGGGGQSGDGVNDQSLNNILIISENNDPSNPDDNVSGGTLIFTFDEAVMLDEISLLDIDRNEATIVLYDIDGNQIQSTQVYGKGNNSFQTVALNALGVARMEVIFTGSGAITDIVFCRDGHPIEGASPKFFIAEGSTDDVYRYTADFEQIDGFAIESAAISRGITTTTDGSTAWVVKSNEWVYVYDGSDQTFQGRWDAQGPEIARGIATNDTDIWIVDDKLNRVYFYADSADWSSGRRQATSSFALNSQNTNPSGLEVHGDVLWVTDLRRDQVFVYDTSGSYLGKWNLDSANGRSSGIATDASGQNLWVTDYNDGKVYYYAGATSLRSGSRNATSTIALPGNNPNPEGIADPVELIQIGDVVSGTVEAGGELVELHFEGTTGQTLFIDSQSISGGRLVIELIAPDNSVLLTDSSSFTNLLDNGPFELTQTGNFKLTIRNASSSGTASYRLLFADVPPTVTQSIQIDESVSTTFTTPGEIQQFEFFATADQRITFAANSLSGGFVNLSLTAPDGSTVFTDGSQFAGNQLLNSRIDLSETGIYTFTVDPSGDDVPNLTFEFYDVVPDNVQSIDRGVTISDQIDGPYSRDIFEFDAIAGEETLVLFEAVAGGALSWALDRPDGTRVSGSLTSNRLIDLDSSVLGLSQTGTYRFTVLGSGSGTPSYEFRLFDIPAPEVSQLVLGQETSGQISTAGARNILEFDASAGQQLYVDFLAASDNTSFEILAPDGSRVTRTLAEFVVNNLNRTGIDLDQTGTYQMVLRGDNLNAPAYRFVADFVPAADVFNLELGQKAEGRIEVLPSVDRWLFDAEAGQSVYIDWQAIVSSPGDTTVLYQLIAPDGEVLTTGRDFILNSLDRGPISLDQTGQYTFQVSGTFGDTPDFYQFGIYDASTPTPVTIGFNTPISNDVDRPGQAQVYEFVANAGQTFTLDQLNNPSGVEFTLLDPSGNSLFVDRTTDQTIDSLTQSGTYTLVANLDGDNQGGYSFRLLDTDLNVPAPEAADLVVTSVITPASLVDSTAEITVSWTVTNQGTVATTASRWIDRVQFGNDGTYNDVDDRLALELAHDGVLQPGESYTATATFAVPENFTGELELAVETDAINQVFELSNENNNVTFADAPTAIYTDVRASTDQANLSFNIADNSIFPAGTTIPLTGQASTTAGTANLIFIVDVSTSTQAIDGLDANFDGVVDANDDINNDGRVGDILDAELSSVIQTINLASQQASDLQVSILLFAGDAALLDLGPALQNQAFVDPAADDNLNGIADFEEALTGVFSESLIFASNIGARQFRSLIIGDGTNFQTPLVELESLLQRAQDVDQTNVYFLTDGAAVEGPTALQLSQLGAAGIDFRALQIGGTNVSDSLQNTVDGINAGTSTATAQLVADPRRFDIRFDWSANHYERHREWAERPIIGWARKFLAPRHFGAGDQ